MIATVYNNSSEEEREILFEYSENYYLGQIFLYQQFIHNVVLGKPRNVAIREFEEWFRRAKDEKKALRLISYLKNQNPFLSKNTHSHAKVIENVAPLSSIVASLL
jgi:hypothetical protein